MSNPCLSPDLSLPVPLYSRLRSSILDLSSNHISVLPRVMLHPLPALETLYLESNKIKVMPDDWFMKKEEVPYLYLSINPWTCNCSLKYLHKYLNDYEFNVYVRDGPIINSDAESVVCESPQLHKGKAVMSLDESDLCSKETPDSDASHVVTAVYRDVRTWSWYRTFTLMEAAHHSASLSRGDGSRSLNAPLMGSITSITERPGTTMIIPPEPATSKSTAPTAEPRPWETPQIPSKTTTIPSKTTTIPTKTTTTASKTTTTKGIATMAATVSTKITTTTSSKATTSSPSLGGSVTAADRWARTRAHRAAAAFCFWLFVVCLLLCITSAACVAVTGVWLWMWYRRVYRPRSKVQARRGVGGERVELLTLNKEEKEATGGVKALYRSVLYVHREEEAAEEKEADGGKEQVLVNLQPTAAEGATRGGETRVYRKTLYRLISKEEAIEAWRVMEECRVSAEEAGRKVGGEGGARGGGASKRSYSVILREEREEAGGARQELDWVVGGWEVKEAEPRSSWGEWLAGFLPSMPWGEATPPEDGAAL
ncbi:leucine-rich repeat-containing protein 4 isoform X2 [Betta splendens]|uniref:Leucine-rich repeat-containing protein 4 isoform X2 n=1 Tax=Betta splendens TaxID=158456 RepID=A0A8M1HKB1_BETSP|nr:leucine-rich repeat-containing protein 4 isoform X2 [Betta splendens]